MLDPAELEGEQAEGLPLFEDGDVLFATSYSSPRSLVSWLLGLGVNARLVGPAELAAELRDRLERLRELHDEEPPQARRKRAARAGGAARVPPSAPRARGRGGPLGGRDPPRALRAPRDAREHPDRRRPRGEPVAIAEIRERLQISEEELREDVGVLNVVNFGGGSYVLYAEINEEAGEIEVDPEPYSDNFDRPARLLPVEAKALVAAIDLIGEHIPEGSLASARKKIVAALGEDPMEQGLQVAPPAGDDSDVARTISKAITGRRLIELEYYKENEDEISTRKVEPYALTNGREGWYVACFDPERDGVRHFRLDRIKSATVSDERFRPRPEVDPAAEVDGWLRTGEVEASRSARVWVSPERARWAREARRVVEERSDGAGDRRAELRRRRLARARDPPRSRRRRRARAPGRARGRPRGRGAASRRRRVARGRGDAAAAMPPWPAGGSGPAMSRREQIRMERRRGRRVPRARSAPSPARRSGRAAGRT